MLKVNAYRVYILVDNKPMNVLVHQDCGMEALHYVFKIHPRALVTGIVEIRCYDKPMENPLRVANTVKYSSR